MRVIDENGNQLGVLPREAALKIAQERSLDLIEISPTSNPVVCRVANYDKFRYLLTKKEKEKRKHSKKLELKEIRLGVRTGEHDLAFKRQRAREFLKDGVKVKVEIVLRGREHTHRDLAREVINKFLNELKDEASFQFEQPVMGSPRGFNCVVSSRK
jgi:translation initiation factor IF-3